MSVRKREWTTAKFDKYLKAGKGQGIGENYIPWIGIRDFGSQGRSHRILGWKTNRVHHLLSDLEKRMFYVLEWSDAVIDIREQYPLLDLKLAMDIAEDANIKYPKDSHHQTPYVLTTDFMITMKRHGKIVSVARTVKYVKDLDSSRTLEKLEIEKRYYEIQNIDWGIVTDKGLSPTFAANVEWLHSCYRLDWEPQTVVRIGQILKERLATEETTVPQVTNALDCELNLEKGTSLLLFRHLVARKEILIDMFSCKIFKDLPTQSLQKIQMSHDSRNPHQRSPAMEIS